jgi:hypothetical protein
MNDKADSSLARMLGVLDLFNEQRLHGSAEDIAEALQVSLPTSYRYLKTLSDAGLLRRGSDAQFTLGPRIVMLDHFIWGSVRRISPEAPVPVVEVVRESYHAGGAANVAGTANTGGGGGGDSSSNGGSGIVIIRYPNTFADAVNSTGTKSSITGWTVYTFTASGTITF